MHLRCIFNVIWGVSFFYKKNIFLDQRPSELPEMKRIVAEHDLPVLIKPLFDPLFTGKVIDEEDVWNIIHQKFTLIEHFSFYVGTTSSPQICTRTWER